MTRALLLALPLALTLSCQRQDANANAGDFFRNKTITYIVATRAGGGYDTYARAIAKYMAPHIPGVKIVVANVPGAADMIGANQIYTAAPDGLTMGTFTMGLMYSQLAESPGVRYDLGRMSWIGKAASEPRAFVVSAKSSLNSVDDLRRSPAPLRLWTGAVGSPAYYATQMLAEATGFRHEIVPGFEEDEGVLAILRGDVAGGISSPTSVAPMLGQGLVRILLAIGTGPVLDPAAVQARSAAVSPLGEEMMTFVAFQSELARVTAAPPGVPADRLAILRDAYMAAVNDPALRADLARIGFPIDPLDGERVAARVAQALHPSPGVVAWLRAAAQR